MVQVGRETASVCDTDLPRGVIAMARRKPPAEEKADASGDGPRAGEELVVVRAGEWRLLVPLRHVERVLPAAMPVARPSSVPTAPAIALGETLVPVVFAQALVGSGEVRLALEHQMIVLADGDRRALLWVDGVEDIVVHAPVTAPAGTAPGSFAVGWSGAEQPLAVLDVPRILAIAA